MMMTAITCQGGPLRWDDEPHEEEKEDPFAGRGEMEGSCLTGLSSSLAGRESFIKPSPMDVRTWRETRGDADMHKAIPVTMIDRVYSGHPDAAPFTRPHMPTTDRGFPKAGQRQGWVHEEGIENLRSGCNVIDCRIVPPGDRCCPGQRGVGQDPRGGDKETITEVSEDYD